MPKGAFPKAKPRVLVHKRTFATKVVGNLKNPDICVRMTLFERSTPNDLSPNELEEVFAKWLVYGIASINAASGDLSFEEDSLCAFHISLVRAVGDLISDVVRTEAVAVEARSLMDELSFISVR